MKIELTQKQIWSVGENMKPHQKDFEILIETNADGYPLVITIDGQSFWFDNYIEYVHFIKGFKFAVQMLPENVVL